MKKQRREKSDRYRSIGQKQMTVLIVSVLLSILLFSGYFFFSVRQNSVQEYVQRSENAVDVSVHNIDYYIENCISSARSIYVDNDIVSLLSQNSRGPLTTGQMEQIYSYLQTVYYSTSGSEQIFLASLRLSQSFLYIAKYLQSSATELSLSIEELPSFSSWRSLYVQPTHTMSSYGHVTRFDAPVREAPDELVFTLWFPVYNLPQGDEVIALVAIDFPIAFLNQNCQLVYEDDEQMYRAFLVWMSTHWNGCCVSNLPPTLLWLIQPTQPFRNSMETEISEYSSLSTFAAMAFTCCTGPQR